MEKINCIVTTTAFYSLKLEQSNTHYCWIFREKMLQVLLCITTGVLGDVPIFNRRPTDLQKRLATPIFQVLMQVRIAHLQFCC